MKATVMSGISASGKSTAAAEMLKKNKNAVEVNRDSIRIELMNKDGKEFSWEKWNWKREDEVTEIAQQRMNDAAASGKDLIVSDTNLNAGRRQTLVDYLKKIGYEVEVKEFHVSIEEAWKRDAKRPNGVGHSVIARQQEQFTSLVGRKKYVPDPSKPSCILVDIDGTLAHMNGKRGAFEWTKVGVDDVDPAVRTVVNNMIRTMPVIVLSGRDGVCRPETEQWLNDNQILHSKLIMRAEGDQRKDTIVKEEIFWRDIADVYNVFFVIDDRPSVCRMWREVGLKTFQVGNPHIEF